MSDTHLNPPRNGEVAAGTADGGVPRAGDGSLLSPPSTTSGGPPPRSGEDLKADFPGLANKWHYLDTTATAPKPQAMLTEKALTKLGELV